MSRKRIFLTSALLAVLLAVATVLAAPWFLRFDAVRQRLATGLSRATGTEISFTRISFTWFPAPCFRIGRIRMRLGTARVTVPEMRAYPDFDFLRGRKNLLRRLEIIRPSVSLATSPVNGGGPAVPVLPAAVIVVRGATVGIPRIPGWTTTALRANGLNLEIRERDSTMALKLDGRGGASRSTSLALFFDRQRGRVSGNFSVEGLDPALLAPEALGGRINLIRAPMDLRGSFETAAGKTRVSVSGTFPCFRYQGDGNGVVIECGRAAFDISHDRRRTRVEVKSLELKDPAMTLAGIISRQAGEPPVWRLDLHARDVDLGAVRKILLTLWPDHHVVKSVCDIVSGGRAEEADFSIKGPPAAFRHLEDMRIRATVADADIHPPHTQLFLTRTGGRITIENGYLNGQGLSASLGNSRGTDGTLRMDLLHRDRAFSLDIDLDADLAALPTVLDGLVKNRRFRDELSRFSQVSGRGRARLVIDGALPHPAVRVVASGFDAAAKYDRLPWPLRLHGGSLDISHGRVAWQGVAATAGPHRITGTAGEVRWDDGGVRMAIRDTAAAIDAADLLATLNRATGHRVTAVLESLSGPLRVDGLDLAGDPTRPSGWRYSMKIEARGLRWRSPLVPGRHLTEHLEATVDDRTIKVEDSRTWSMGSPVRIVADIRHHALRPSGFSITIDGTVRKPMAVWLTERGWLPESLLPATPMTLHGLRVTAGKGRVGVTGRLVAGTAAPGATTADLALEVDSGSVDLENLVVRGHGRTITIGLHHDRGNAATRGGTTLTWQGSLAGASVTDLLAAPGLGFGRASGRGTATIVPGAAPRLTGTLEAAGVRFPAASGITTVIDLVKVRGKKGRGIEIEKLHLDHGGRKVRIAGWLDPEASPPVFDLAARAGQVSLATLAGIRKDLPAGSGKAASGTFGFAFGRLEDINGPVAGKGLTMQPARGELRVADGKWQTLKLSRSRLCGLEFDGIFHPPDSRLESSFNLYSGEGQVSGFDQVLPCLGFSNNMVSGEVSVDAHLAGRPGNWRTGRLNLYSRKGFIRRLTMLSRALSLLNITGIVSGSLIEDMKHKGFSYSELEVKSHVSDNRLTVDKAVIRGSGLNIFASGTIDIDSRACDLVMLLAPLKTIDTIVGNLPIIGRALGGRDTAIIALPVKVIGRIDDPEVRVLPAGEVGKGIGNFVARVVKLPFALLSPLIPGTGGGKGRTEKAR